MKAHITITGQHGVFGAYIARPEPLPAPTVVVLQELFGVNADIRKHCDELAEQGFIAVAPDLYWRQEPGVDLSVTSDPDWQHGLRLYQAYDRDAGAKDVKDTADTAAKLPECTGKVAVLGYCLGGLMTFLTAARYRVDAAIAYHGADTEKYLREVDGLQAPMLMHLAEEDESFQSPHKPRSRPHWQANPTRPSLAIRVSVTPSLGTMGHTTTPTLPHLPTDVPANF
jgi:carboxymethylenebutenolidase